MVRVSRGVRCIGGGGGAYGEVRGRERWTGRVGEGGLCGVYCFTTSLCSSFVAVFAAVFAFDVLCVVQSFCSTAALMRLCDFKNNALYA